MPRCVTLIGTASIQDYVFRSNRLKENVGASWIVSNALNQLRAWPNRIFIGGGNAAFEFEDCGPAIARVESWSFNLLKSYPGLRISAWHEPLQESECLSDAFLRAQKKLSLRENRPASGFELGALSVVRDCASTGLAANDWMDGSWLSQEAIAKRNAVKANSGQLRDFYGGVLQIAGENCHFPDELDLLGQEKGASQIAIVHADGNGVGEILRKLCAEKNDAVFKRKIGDASEAIQNIAANAFRQTLQDLSGVLPSLARAGIRLAARGGKQFYPVRPIVDGGDDLTFVCHGRLGLALAARYLENFERESRNHAGALEVNELTACAGILIMPQKFPFARGYRLAERLTESAKQRRRLENSGKSWIDFHVLLEGSAGSLAKIRSGYRRRLPNETCELMRRPYALGSDEPRAWKTFEKHVEMFQDREKWPRSRAKRLLEALARGREETEQLLKQYRMRGIELPSPPWELDTPARDHVFSTSYFDPIELLDFHVVWPRGKEATNGTAD